MVKTIPKSNYSGTVKKSILIKTSRDKVWRKVSNIVGLPEWLIDVKKQFIFQKLNAGSVQFETLHLMMEIKLRSMLLHGIIKIIFHILQ